MRAAPWRPGERASHDSILELGTPDSAIKPTAAEIENGIPRSQRVTMPPLSASGTAAKTVRVCLNEPNVLYSSSKTQDEARGNDQPQSLLRPAGIDAATAQGE